MLYDMIMLIIGLYLFLLLTVLDARMKSVLEKHIGNVPNVRSTYVLIQAKIVSLIIILKNKFLLWT